jgi:hypothetical protein
MRYYKTTIEHSPNQLLVCHTHVDAESCPQGYYESTTEANKKAAQQLEQYAQKCRHEANLLNRDFSISLSMPEPATVNYDNITLTGIKPYPCDVVSSLNTPLNIGPTPYLSDHASDMSYNT